VITHPLTQVVLTRAAPASSLLSPRQADRVLCVLSKKGREATMTRPIFSDVSFSSIPIYGR
jgi:hypothetical protein